MASQDAIKRKISLPVCVFCGASPGTSSVYLEATHALAKVFAENSWSLVFGGGTVGLMGALASTLVSLGGEVHGIIPKALVKHERSGKLPPESEYGRTTVVDNMHERKAMMGREAKAFIALPGGFGTFEELFEVVTWNQLGIHDYPIIVLNIDGFYDGLLQFIENAVAAGFIKDSCKTIISEARAAEEVAQKIKEYQPASGRYNLDWNSEGPGRPKLEGERPL